MASFLIGISKNPPKPSLSASLTQFRRRCSGIGKNQLASQSDTKARENELHRLIARYEDAGHGDAVFTNPDCAQIIQNKFTEGHGSRYSLIDWCVMPNHVHVLVRLQERQTLAEIVRLWKSGSAIEVNRILKRTGQLWQRDYYDRSIRDMDHLHDCIAYIRNNPVIAGLCSQPEDRPFSSAGMNWQKERWL